MSYFGCEPRNIPAVSLRSSTQRNSARQAGDGDLSVPDPFSEMPPSASWTPEKAAEPGDWGRGRRVLMIHPYLSPPPPRRGGERPTPLLGAGLSPAQRAPQRAGLQRLQRGEQQARCTCAGRSPRPWRCRWGRPPAPRRSGRTVSARRWPGPGSHRPNPKSTGASRADPAGALCSSAPVGQTRPEAAEAWVGDGGTSGGGSRGRRPKVLGDFESWELLQRGFWIWARLPGSESWSWASDLTCFLICKTGTVTVGFQRINTN